MSERPKFSDPGAQVTSDMEEERAAERAAFYAAGFPSHPTRGGPVRYATIEGTVWPVDDDGEVEWDLRYRQKNLTAASFVAAYKALTDPAYTQGDAVAMLKRARAARSSERAEQ